MGHLTRHLNVIQYTLFDRMLVDGPSIKCQSDVSACTRAALSISQPLIFNSVKNNRKTHLTRHKHDPSIVCSTEDICYYMEENLS